VTLVGRRSEPLDRLAKDLTGAGATAHVITADLSDTGATPRLAEQIRAHVGAAIKNSAFHVEMEKAKAAGDPVWEMPIVDPEHLAGMLWAMHETKGQREAIYP
jgi:short-subunit dehydrogenase